MRLLLSSLNIIIRQVVVLHHMLSKATVKARPNVLWCYKKELGFSSHRKKKMKQLNKKIKAGKMEIDEENPFEMFIASTNIHFNDACIRCTGSLFNIAPIEALQRVGLAQGGLGRIRRGLGAI